MQSHESKLLSTAITPQNEINNKNSTALHSSLSPCVSHPLCSYITHLPKVIHIPLCLFFLICIHLFSCSKVFISLSYLAFYSLAVLFTLIASLCSFKSNLVLFLFSFTFALFFFLLIKRDRAQIQFQCQIK